MTVLAALALAGKSLTVFGFLVYLVFAFVVTRQIALMTEVVESPFNFVLRIVSWVHLFLSILLVALSVVIL